METVDLEVPLVEVGDILTNGVKFYTVKKITGNGAESVLSLMGISGVPLEERLVSMIDHGYAIRAKGATVAQTAESAQTSADAESVPAVQSQAPTDTSTPIHESAQTTPPMEVTSGSNEGSTDQPSSIPPRKSVQEIIDDLKREEEENIERIRKKTAEKIFKAAQKAQSPSEKRKEALEKMDLMREKIRVIHPFMLDADVDQKIMLAIDSYISSISDCFSKEGAKEGASENLMRIE